MKILSWKNLVIGTILLLCVTQIHASHFRSPRQALASRRNDLDLDDLAFTLYNLPYIGGLLADLLNYIGETFLVIDKLTNGLLSRLLGGSLPCELSLPVGLACSGTSRLGGDYGIVKKLINSVPEVMLPKLLKLVLLVAIRKGVNPVVNALFGGIPKLRR